MFRVVRVARAVLLETGELGRHRLAENQRARLPQQPNHRRLRPREQFRWHARPRTRHEPIHMVNVLDADEHAKERRTRRRIGPPCLQRLRIPEQPSPPVRLRQQRRNVRLNRLDPRARLIDVLIKRNRPGTQVSGEQGQRSRRDVHARNSLRVKRNGGVIPSVSSYARFKNSR